MNWSRDQVRPACSCKADDKADDVLGYQEPKQILGNAIPQLTGSEQTVWVPQSEWCSRRVLVVVQDNPGQVKATSRVTWHTMPSMISQVRLDILYF